MALKQLGTEHWLCIKYLALPKKDRPTLKEIADECGVHEQSIYNWKRDELFTKELKKEMVRQTHNRLPEAIESMMDAAITDKSAAMMKLVLQANDMLKDQLEVTTDNKADKDIEDIKAKIASYTKTIEE